MAAGKVGGGGIAAVIVTVVAVAAMQVPGARCRPVLAAAAPSGVEEAEQCVSRCARDMLACAAAAACASGVRVAVSASGREGGGEGSEACGGGCQNEYLGCIDVC